MIRLVRCSAQAYIGKESDGRSGKIGLASPWNQLFCVSNIFRTAGGMKIPSRLSLLSDFARTRIFLRLESFLLMRIMGFPETRQ